jgi:hypothetical protein
MSDGRNLGRNRLLALSVALFAACLLLPPYYSPSDSGDKSDGLGFHLLVMGWLGLWKGIPAWLANPALLAAWVVAYLRLYRLSFALSLVSVALMLSFLSVREIPDYETSTKITGYGLGYWLWIGSALAQLLGSALMSRSVARVAQLGVAADRER